MTQSSPPPIVFIVILAFTATSLTTTSLSSFQAASSGTLLTRKNTLLVFDFAGNGHTFTPLDNGVAFDFDGSGRRERTGWLSLNSDDAFLTLDVDGDGAVTSATELLGSGYRGPDGRTGMSGVDSLLLIQGSGPNPAPPLPDGLGTIDKADPIFSKLRAWRDSNRDARSDPSELKTLTELSVNRISLLFRRMPGTADSNGNRSLFRGAFYIDQRGMPVQRQMTEVQFVR